MPEGGREGGNRHKLAANNSEAEKNCREIRSLGGTHARVLFQSVRTRQLMFFETLLLPRPPARPLLTWEPEEVHRKVGCIGNTYGVGLGWREREREGNTLLLHPLTITRPTSSRRFRCRHPCWPRETDKRRVRFWSSLISFAANDPFGD